MNSPWPALAVVFRMQLRRAFCARRGLWIYLLALAPFLLFAGYNLQTKVEARQRRQWAAEQQKPLTARDFAAVRPGMSETQLVATLGRPPRLALFRRRRRVHGAIVYSLDAWYRYTDGANLYFVAVQNGKVRFVRTRSAPTLGNVNLLFATVFQFFYLRLAVFFGCLGIFLNLFRGEMLDKSLHFYFLAPVRREVVLAGKFLAGLVAALVVFVGGAALQILLLGRLAGRAGLGHLGAYLGVTALACLGYGAVFLAAGLLFKNPIVPAVSLLLWESLNPFLPELLKKLSVLYYLTQLCPVSVASGPGVSPLFALLVSAPGAISPAAAVGGLLLLTALILIFAARRVRRLEIDYSAD